MEPTDLTVRILQDIRDDVRGLRDEQRATREELKLELRALADRTERRFEAMETRFEVIETTLRDLAQQLVALGRGVKIAIEQRTRSEDRLDSIERRVDELEKKTG